MYWQCIRCETSNSVALIECDVCNTLNYSSVRELKKAEAKIKAEVKEAKRKARESIKKIKADFNDWLIDTDEFYIEEAEFYIENLPTNPYVKIKTLLNINKPPNLKALYIARHFCKESEKLKYSLRLLKAANSEEKLELDVVWRIYQTTEEKLKSQVFNVLCDDQGMMLKSPQGEKLVYEESKELFENLQIDKQMVELLGIRVIANNLKTASLSNHIAKIKNYTTGFIND